MRTPVIETFTPPLGSTDPVAGVAQNVPGGLDSSTFFSPCIPSEVRAAVPLLHDHVMPLDEQARRQLVGAVVAAALHGKVRQACSGVLPPSSAGELTGPCRLVDDAWGGLAGKQVAPEALQVLQQSTGLSVRRQWWFMPRPACLPADLA